MTIVEAALSATWPSEPRQIAFGYYAPVDSERVDDPPAIAAVIQRFGDRVMSWADARPALEALGNRPAASVTVDGTVRLQHDGAGWRIA